MYCIIITSLTPIQFCCCCFATPAAQVLQINGGVGVLGVHALFVLLHLQLPPSTAAPNELSEEESKSLWHQMADSMLAVQPDDRNRFLDLCLKRRVLCSQARFEGPQPTFHWRAGVTLSTKDRFWHAYSCAYDRDIRQCPVDGGWSSWSPWSRCSATCDATGNQTRTRTCSNPVPVRGGERCHGSVKRTRPCLGACTDPAKGGGVLESEAFLKQVHDAYPSLQHDCYDSHCTYGVVQKVISEKHVRAKYWSSLSCVKYRGACPVDGQWGAWGVWSQCSLKCGTGSRTRSRTCDQPQPAFGGHPCKGEFHQQESCIRKDCGPTTTETFTEWTLWTPCSVSCGNYGFQSSTRVCLRHAGCDLHGVLTPYINRSRPCYAGDCPNQGGWNDWSDWTECSAACSAGRQSRMRLCDSPFPTGGRYCLGDPVEFRLCKGENCAGQPAAPPENTGFIRRPGAVDEDVMIGKSDEYLNGALNPTLESLYTPWAAWAPCTVSCGTGTRKRVRWCSAQTNPMPPCEGEIRQIQFCNVFVCPVAGGWGVWMPWTPCSKTCSTGKRQRYRACNNPLPQFGGSCDGDLKRVEDCDLDPCPRLASGTWSKWSMWTSCTVTCGGGERLRERSRHRMDLGHPIPSVGKNPVVGGTKIRPDTGSTEVLDCNTQPCPVQGSWAEWGEWSRCSVLCGLGRRTRDRTCTDPSPLFGGEPCFGPGTDLEHCFAGPCKDAEDRAVFLGRTSWLRYAPRNRPSRFLVLYIHFRPMEPSGYMLRRYRQCRSVFDEDEEDDKNDDVDDADKANNKADRKADSDDKCELVVELKLEQAQAQLSAKARGATLEIASPVVLSLGAWHEILVEVLKTGASMRVNDQPRLYANFSRQLVRDLDFDSYMILGAVDNKTSSMPAMVGSISTVSVNFRHQDLFSSTDWEGQGTPVGRHAVSMQSINPSVQLPHFRGLYYSPLKMHESDRLTVRLTTALDKGDGLLLYARGQADGTIFTLGIKNARPVLCMVCSRAQGNTCHRGDLLRLRQWYHMALHVEDTEAELRIDQGKALQLTCKGLPFRPRTILYVGGRSAVAWPEVKQITNYTEGFYGVLGTIVVNGQTVLFRRAVLMGRDDRINPDGYSRATRITPVFEHKTSIITLHCEVPNKIGSGEEIKVIWLRSDTVVEPSDYVEIIKPVGMEKHVGSLQLQPAGHTEGIYGCVISRDGRLELAHVFPVFRHTTAPDLYEGNVEWLFLKLFLILIPLLAVICLLYRFRRIEPPIKEPSSTITEEEEEPLLPTEPMELYLPEKYHLHGSDSATSWNNYLAQKEGDLSQINVVSFSPAHSRHLTVTPGVSSERPVVAVDEPVMLGRPQRPNVTNHSAGADPVVQLNRMSRGVDPFVSYGPTEIQPGARRESLNVEGGDEEVFYANLTHNKKPSSFDNLNTAIPSATLPAHVRARSRSNSSGGRRRSVSAERSAIYVRSPSRRTSSSGERASRRGRQPSSFSRSSSRSAARNASTQRGGGRGGGGVGARSTYYTTSPGMGQRGRRTRDQSFNAESPQPCTESRRVSYNGDLSNRRSSASSASRRSSTSKSPVSRRTSLSKSPAFRRESSSKSPAFRRDSSSASPVFRRRSSSSKSPARSRNSSVSKLANQPVPGPVSIRSPNSRVRALSGGFSAPSNTSGGNRLVSHHDPRGSRRGSMSKPNDSPTQDRRGSVMRKCRTDLYRSGDCGEHISRYDRDQLANLRRDNKQSGGYVRKESAAAVTPAKAVHTDRKYRGSRPSVTFTLPRQRRGSGGPASFSLTKPDSRCSRFYNRNTSALEPPDALSSYCPTNAKTHAPQGSTAASSSPPLSMSSASTFTGSGSDT